MPIVVRMPTVSNVHPGKEVSRSPQLSPAYKFSGHFKKHREAPSHREPERWFLGEPPISDQRYPMFLLARKSAPVTSQCLAACLPVYPISSQALLEGMSNQTTPGRPWNGALRAYWPVYSGAEHPVLLLWSLELASARIRVEEFYLLQGFMPSTWPWKWLGCMWGGLSSRFFHCITFSTAILIEGSPGRKEAGGYAPSPLLAYKPCFAGVNRGPRAPQGLVKGSIEWQVNEGPRPRLCSVLLLKLSTSETTPHTTRSHYSPLRKFFKNINPFLRYDLTTCPSWHQTHNLSTPAFEWMLGLIPNCFFVLCVYLNI